jgi:hypothetical protein
MVNLMTAAKPSFKTCVFKLYAKENIQEHAAA